MRVGEEFYFDSGGAYITSKSIKFYNGYEIPIQSIQDIRASDPAQRLEWWPWHRRRLRVAAACFVIGALMAIVTVAGIVISSIGIVINSSEYELLTTLAPWLWGIFWVSAIYFFLDAFRFKPEYERRYQITIYHTGGDPYSWSWTYPALRDDAIKYIDNAREMGSVETVMNERPDGGPARP